MATALRPGNPGLATRRNLLLGQLRTNTAGAVGRVWQAMPDHSADSQDDFATAASPIVVGGQSKAIDLAVAYLAALTGIGPKLDRPAVLLGAAVDLAAPFLTFGQHLNAGDSPEEALAAGLDRAQTMAADGVQWAARSSASAFDHSDQVTAWERIPNDGACEWCLLVAGQAYRTADSAAFGHANCSCDVGPLLAGESPG